ncbi:hypothetical protein G9P44_001642 [Scheffersomyces stipitis]|nr:hypothetical protein G9P44_001642 [Scheffersomyces stipitis]
MYTNAASAGATSTQQQPEPGRGRSGGPTSGSATPSFVPSNSNKKQYHGNSKLKVHNRSMSHNKLVTSLSTSAKHTGARPSMNRSKSSDVLIKTRSTGALKRNNRSFTKISGLQPLTKTVSNQSIRSNKSTGSLKMLNATTVAPLHGIKTTSRKGRAILKLNEDDANNEEYEDLNDDNNEEIDNSNKSNSSNDNADDDRTFSSGSDRRGRSNVDPQLRSSQFLQNINATSVVENAVSLIEQINNVPDDLPKLVNAELPEVETVENANEDYKNGNRKESENQNERGIENENRSRRHDGDDSVRFSMSQTELHSPSPSTGEDREDSRDNSRNGRNHSKGPVDQLKRELSSARSSTDDLTTNNLYGGSLLLSQSTGLTKKIDPKNANHHLHQKMLGADVYTTGNINVNNGDSHKGRTESSIESNHSETISGISFRANPIESHLAEPVTTNRNVVQNNSYQPNQTIFNNLQRTNNQYLNTKKQSYSHNQQQQQKEQQQHHIHQQQNQIQQPTHPVNTGVNNFSNFLTNNSTSTPSSAESHSAHNIETRTQQRLWLQRENSLMDVTNLDPSQLSNFSNLSLNNLMFAHNYNGNQSQVNMRDIYQQQQSPLTPVGTGSNLSNTNAAGAAGGSSSLANNQVVPHQGGSVDSYGSLTNVNGLLHMVQSSHQNSIQSRTEFERLNREYLNVRRHLNPIGECLNRLEKTFPNREIKVLKNTKKAVNASSSSLSVTHSSNSNTFKEFSPLYQEKEKDIGIMLNRLWQDAIISSSSTAANSMRNAPLQNNQHMIPSQQVPSQRPMNPRVSSYNQNQSQFGNMRSQQTPTTRAVKLAGQGGTNASSQSSIPSSQIRRGSEQSVNIA